jgi:hypothetical protein
MRVHLAYSVVALLTVLLPKFHIALCAEFEYQPPKV